MKQIRIIMLLISLLVFSTAAMAANNVKVIVFYGQGCPHCEALFTFLGKIGPEHPTLEIVGYEVYNNAENRQLLSDLLDTYGKTFEGVPTTFIANNYTIGFSTAIGGELLGQISYCEENVCPDPLLRVEDSRVINLTKQSVPTQWPALLNIGTIAAIFVAACLFIFLITRRPRGEKK